MGEIHSGIDVRQAVHDDFEFVMSLMVDVGES
jgi:hypothetical protein